MDWEVSDESSVNRQLNEYVYVYRCRDQSHTYTDSEWMYVLCTYTWVSTQTDVCLQMWSKCLTTDDIFNDG